MVKSPVQSAQWLFEQALRHHQAGRIADAAELYRRALALNPDLADAHNNLGIALAAQGRADAAVAHYERAIALNPSDASAHNNLGVTLADLARNNEAIAHYERAVGLKPDYASAHHNLGMALAAQGRQEEAVAHYRRAVAIQPGHADAHNNLGVALAALGKTGEAVAHYERALALRPDLADIHNNLGVALVEQGRVDEALPHYAAALALNPANVEAHFNRAELKTFRQGDPDLAALEALAGRDDLPPKKMPLIHFALAKALEDTGEYGRAFEHLRRANDLKRRQVQYDEAGVARLFRRIAAVFGSGLFERFQGEGDPSTVPVFVLGMPRSGSTLIEQILAGHPRIHGAGELPELERAAGAVLNACARPAAWPECVPALDGATLRRIGQAYLARLPAVAEGKVRIVDKLPDNFLMIGLIRLILPNARIIHSVRDPVDTCVSCYSKRFTSGQSFSYDLAELGRYYRCYSELMTHWRAVLPPGAMLEVAYEDVVDDIEGQARRLIEFCGLPWDDRCVSFHETGRTVKTASAAQVRRPLFRSSLQRWRRYEAELGPLLRELGDVVPDHAPVRERWPPEPRGLSPERHTL